MKIDKNMNYLNLSRMLKYLMILACFSSAEAQTKINALTIMIDFPDQPGFAPIDTVANVLNKEKGYKSFGLNGSVREYWADVTAGKIVYTSKVIGWYRTSKTRAAYESAADGFGDVLNEVLPKIANTSFTGLTLRPNTNEVYSVNIVVEGAWNNTFRPVATRLQNIRIVNDGVDAFLTDAALSTTKGDNTEMSLSNFAHETGHSTFWWPEHYMWQSRIGGLGNYCLMANIGTDPEKNPVPPNAGIRLKKGWIGNVVSLNVSANQTFTVTANDMNKTFKYTNPNNPREYFLVEAYQKKGRFLGMSDEGLAIWYVDEAGGLKLPVEDRYLRVKLMEADGLDQIAKGLNVGDVNDFFDSNKPTFSDFTTPNARWKDGSYSGLKITNISAVGAQMTFNVEVSSGKLNITSGDNGKVSPAGVVRANLGASQLLQFTPDLGYVVSKITVNGVTSNYSATSYTFNNISANSTFKVEFQKASSGFTLPAPWLAKDFGTNVLGEAYYSNGVFLTKKFGWDIWGTQDNFQYIYQPLSGDGEFIAKVSEQDATSEWSKSGIMIRESLVDNSKHALMCVTPWQGPAFQYRVSNGAESFNENKWDNRDKWVKLVRKGNLFSGYYSADGVTWTLLKETTITMTTAVYVGLASVGSTDLAKNTTKFENVKFTPASSNLLAKYGVPRATPLPVKPTLQYNKVITLGVGGPNLSNVKNSIFTWNTSINQLTQFSLETSNGVPRYYTGLESPTYSTNTFNQANPSITLKNTGFANLDNSYYANFNGNDLVLVEKTGKYALYFCYNCTSAPAREEALFEEESIADNSLASYPNPFNSTITVDLSKMAEPKRLTVQDLAGNVLEGFNIEGESSLVLGQNYASGIYLVKIEGVSQTSMLKIVKE